MRTKRLLASATIVAALAVAAAPPASAATGYNRCPEFRMCVFTGPNGTGAIAYFATADAHLGDAYGPQGMNNNIESIWNRSGHRWHLYDGAGYTGQMWESDPLPGNTGKNNVKPGAVNRVTSLHDY